jgi:hypothetical protein
MVAVRSMLYMGLRECEALSMLWTGFDQDRRVYTAVDTARIYAMISRNPGNQMLQILRRHFGLPCTLVFDSSSAEISRTKKNAPAPRTTPAPNRGMN